MSSVVDSGVGRGASRPLSGGLWTLFSWLRRDSSSSSDSVSSAGSDRTALSFAYLHPRNYHTPSSPTILGPLDSPTNSYKKRVRDSNFRRRYDRDITLHRKYGLYKGDSSSYDAFSLPPARRNLGTTLEKQERDRRATSEYFHRRSAHVPGKRRAPLPPTRTNSAEPTNSATINRRHSRKRPAPQPPVKFTEQIKENIEPSSGAEHLKQMNSTDKSTILETEDEILKRRLQGKYGRSGKPSPEKGFFKQMFDQKKRYSGSESYIKLLPNISELDREAAEIIESRRLKVLEHSHNISDSKANNDKLNMVRTSFNSNYWFCTKCLRKFDSSVMNCVHCELKQKGLNGKVAAPATSMHSQTEIKNIKGPSTSRVIEVDEKQKLKEMLKEMKHSLPKRQSIEVDGLVKTDNSIIQNKELETPTLRIGSTNTVINNTQPTTNNNSGHKILDQSIEAMRKAVVKQKVVVLNNSDEPKKHIIHQPRQVLSTQSAISVQNSNKQILDRSGLKNENYLNAPLRISTLLNPVYVPIIDGTNPPKKMDSDKPLETSMPTSFLTSSPTSINVVKAENNKQVEYKNRNLTAQTTVEVKQHLVPTTSNPLLAAARDAKFNLDKLDRHSRRRELINQLEQSIAKGDEHAAAEAASKLAQLKLSCSVLSFTSQKVGETSSPAKNSAIPETSGVNKVKLKPKSFLKVNTASQCVKPDISKINKTSDKGEEKREQAVVLPTKIGLTEARKAVDSRTDVSSNKPLASSEASTSSLTKNDSNMASIEVWVEDREAARGPIHLNISRRAVLSDLRRQAQTSLGLAMQLQRWIIGTTLCANDDIPLINLAGNDLSAPFYLCVVESESSNTNATKLAEAGKALESRETKTVEPTDVYAELMLLERCALVPNKEPFECEVCMEACPAGRGAVLRECVHTFCRECLADVIKHCEEPTVSCPATGCPGDLQEREVRALVSPEEYEKWLARGLAAAECGSRNAFHCRTKDCTGWAMCDPGVRRFPCPVCKRTNCVQCQAIHEDDTCEQHRAKLRAATVASTSGHTDEGTRTLLENLIARGEALECPECKAIITKKWGCDWIKCSACKTEICWVTRGRRWGPDGRGDTSGGCRCGVDGKRCHPSCGYCH